MHEKSNSYIAEHKKQCDLTTVCVVDATASLLDRNCSYLIGFGFTRHIYAKILI